jgi:hypothetical protein
VKKYESEEAHGEQHDDAVQEASQGESKHDYPITGFLLFLDKKWGLRVRPAAPIAYSVGTTT